MDNFTEEDKTDEIIEDILKHWDDEEMEEWRNEK